MSRELNELELSSAIGGLKFSISSQKANLMSALGGQQEGGIDDHEVRSGKPDQLKN